MELIAKNYPLKQGYNLTAQRNDIINYAMSMGDSADDFRTLVEKEKNYARLRRSRYYKINGDKGMKERMKFRRQTMKEIKKRFTLSERDFDREGEIWDAVFDTEVDLGAMLQNYIDSLNDSRSGRSSRPSRPGRSTTPFRSGRSSTPFRPGRSSVPSRPGRSSRPSPGGRLRRSSSPRSSYGASISEMARRLSTSPKSRAPPAPGPLPDLRLRL